MTNPTTILNAIRRHDEAVERFINADPSDRATEALYMEVVAATRAIEELELAIRRDREGLKHCACGGTITEPAIHSPGYCATTFTLPGEED
jgi:hypothetical protein